MRETPDKIRFEEVLSLLKHLGFVLFNRRGSHCSLHHPDGRLLTIVRPHGHRKTCHPQDIHKLLELLEP
jgi:predicted RNA binding protein YcfA (HicA-like mRNA interferase family)